MPKNILHTIEKNMSSFSKGQKLIARFILEDYDKAAFMTASKLGKTVQVSESTVVRFATQLGYDGYPSMQRALQEMIRGKLTSIQRIKASEGELSGSDLVTNVLQRDMEKIRMAMDQTDGSEFSHVVDIIAQAKHIYIVGFQFLVVPGGLSQFLFPPDLRQCDAGAGTALPAPSSQLFRVGSGDVVIAICFPRYSELALKTVQYAKDRGATIIGVTDSEMSPVYQMSSGSLLVRNDMISFVDSLAAPIEYAQRIDPCRRAQAGNGYLRRPSTSWSTSGIASAFSGRSRMNKRAHGDRRRSRRNDGGDLRGAQRNSCHAARAERAAGQEAQHHRQGHVQS